LNDRILDELALQIREKLRRELEAAKRKAEETAERLRNIAELVTEEPPPGDNTTQIIVRLSDGTKLRRRFLKSDNLADLFVFIAAKEPQQNYAIVTHFPRAQVTEATLTFEEAKLTPQATLFVEEFF